MAVTGREYLIESWATVNCEEDGIAVEAGRARVAEERLKRTVRPVDSPAATIDRCVGMGDQAIACYVSLMSNTALELSAYSDLANIGLQTYHTHLTSLRTSAWTLTLFCFPDTAHLLAPFVHLDLARRSLSGLTTDDKPPPPIGQGVRQGYPPSLGHLAVSLCGTKVINKDKVTVVSLNGEPGNQVRGEL